MPNSRRMVAAIAVAAIAMLTALAPNGASAASCVGMSEVDPPDVVASAQGTPAARPTVTSGTTAVVTPAPSSTVGSTAKPTPEPSCGTKPSPAPPAPTTDSPAFVAPAVAPLLARPIRDDDDMPRGGVAPVVAPVPAPRQEPGALPWLALFASSIGAFLGLLLFAGLSVTFADPAPGQSLALLRGRLAPPGAGSRQPE